MTKTNQYERPNIVHLFASLPHAGHFVLPGSIAGYEDWSNGIHNDFAPALGARSSCGSEARPLRSLMSSSHASTSHHGSTTTHLLSSVGTTSSQFVMTFRRELYATRARSNMSFWIVVRRAGTLFSMSEMGNGALTPLSRRTDKVCCFVMSAGPISRRRGTP